MGGASPSARESGSDSYSFAPSVFQEAPGPEVVSRKDSALASHTEVLIGLDPATAFVPAVNTGLKLQISITRDLLQQVDKFG